MARARLMTDDVSVPPGHTATLAPAPDATETLDTFDTLGAPFAQAASVSSTGFALVDGNGRITWSTASFARLTQLRGGMTNGGDFAAHLQESFRLADGEAERAFDEDGATTLDLHQDRGETPTVLHVASRVPGKHDRVVVAMVADAARLDAVGNALDEARTDPLTRLGNRKLLEERLADPRRADDGPVALIMVDLDRFKPVNDALGHAVGDKLLMLVADRLERACRATDTVVRLGGDEFVVIHSCVPGEAAGGSSAESIAARIVEVIGRPFLLDGQQVHIGASVGIACLGTGTESPVDLLRHADLALYDAKRAGRATWRHFAPSLELQARERREHEVALRRALVLREFEIVYQPQVALPADVLTGFEALIRWNSSERGQVSPLDFIPLAEEIGEIHAIGEWVLREACAQAVTWPDHLTVAVNISPVQFARERFVDVVAEALTISGLAPHRLEVEITEGVLIDDMVTARHHLDALRALGVGIAMDDFGTGYSSLGYLSSFPFTKIKIDRSFVGGEQTQRSRDLVRSILSLGESLGMATIAEGVETSEQFDELSDGGCHAAQGYLISRPIDVASVAAFIASRPAGERPADTPVTHAAGAAPATILTP